MAQTEAVTEYTDTAPGRCYHCGNKLARVSAGPHSGKFAFVRMKDPIGNAVVAHVRCHESQAGANATVREPSGRHPFMAPIGSGYGWSDGAITSRKPGAE